MNPGPARPAGAGRPAGASVELDHVSATYHTAEGPVEALQDVTLAISPGEQLAIVGPSGCGKSTLVWALAGLLDAAVSGRILVNGETVRPGRSHTALILQDYGLLPWKTAQENAALGLALRGWPRRRRLEAVAPIMDALGLDGVKRLYPAQLSGGQRQRVAIARALMLQPDLLLMDEPFSALDAQAREALQDVVASLATVHGFTTVLITHDIAEAAYLADRIVVLSVQPGRVVAAVDNSRARSPSYRQDPAYFAVMGELRRWLDGRPPVDAAAIRAGQEALMST